MGTNKYLTHSHREQDPGVIFKWKNTGACVVSAEFPGKPESTPFLGRARLKAERLRATLPSLSFAISIVACLRWTPHQNLLGHGWPCGRDVDKRPCFWHVWEDSLWFQCRSVRHGLLKSWVSCVTDSEKNCRSNGRGICCHNDCHVCVLPANQIAMVFHFSFWDRGLVLTAIVVTNFRFDVSHGFHSASIQSRCYRSQSHKSQFDPFCPDCASVKG